MTSFETTAGPGAALTWQPVGVTDYGAIGVTTIVDVSVALLLAHVIWNGDWPPYTAAIPQVVVYASLAVRFNPCGVMSDFLEGSSAVELRDRPQGGC